MYLPGINFGLSLTNYNAALFFSLGTDCNLYNIGCSNSCNTNYGADYGISYGIVCNTNYGVGCNTG